MKTIRKHAVAIIGPSVSVILSVVLIVGCTTPQVVTQPDGSTSTNHIVDPRVTTALATAAAVNAATAPVNPYTVPIELGLGAIAAGFAWYARLKNGQKDAVQEQLRSVIIAVDAHDDEKLKSAIQVQATADGTETALNKTVKGVASGLL